MARFRSLPTAAPSAPAWGFAATLVVALSLLAKAADVHAQPLAAAPAGSAASVPGAIGEVHRLYYAGQTGAALEKADAYLATKPADAQMRFLKGVMLADLQRSAESIVIFEKLIDDYPDLAEPYNNLAALYAAAGDYGRARVTLEKAVRANPNYATAQENLGDVYAALASQSYARAKQLEPGNPAIEPKLVLVRELFKRIPAAGAAASSAPATPR